MKYSFIFATFILTLSAPGTAFAKQCWDGAMPIMHCVVDQCPGGFYCDDGFCCRERVANLSVELNLVDKSNITRQTKRRPQKIPESFKEGTCPQIDAFPQLPGLIVCENDFDCAGPWKCCSTRIGNFCFDVHESAEVDKRETIQTSKSLDDELPVVGRVPCSIDEDCIPPSRCRPTRVGRRCVSAERSDYEDACPKHEEFVKCASPCQTGCIQRVLDNICEETFCRPGCICQSGYIRMYHNEWRSKCVRVAYCTEKRKNYVKPSNVSPSSTSLSLKCQTNLHCPSDYVCSNGVCVISSAEIEDSANKWTLPSNTKENLRACHTDFDCPQSERCSQTRNGKRCISKDFTTTTTRLCPNGYSAESTCSMGVCPIGYTCWKGLCCDSVADRYTSKNRCPPIGPGTPRGRLHLCDSDDDCVLNEHCCLTATGRQCLSLGDGDHTTRNIQKCPDGSESTYTCYKGSCPENLICIENMCCPIKATSTDACPETGAAVFDWQKPTRDQCENDFDCTDYGKKCCPTRAGKRCLANMALQFIGMTERLSACSDGLQPLYKCPATGCPRGYFCENGGCCRRLVSQYHKSDSCPTVQDEDRSKILQSCLINSDCHDNEYCCQGKCVRATKKHASKRTIREK
ncbi:hypothetical protein T01_13826 [Trichinella spiralis]|uniref:WAP domain-containing protein n=2 Tax=Trichinella spiralis TaxID=6334 RepID=A0A0V1BIM0_TRISP|nr:hypothetical protein T01_13826 [Trichinella spiralis]